MLVPLLVLFFDALTRVSLPFEMARTSCGNSRRSSALSKACPSGSAISLKTWREALWCLTHSRACARFRTVGSAQCCSCHAPSTPFCRKDDDGKTVCGAYVLFTNQTQLYSYSLSISAACTTRSTAPLARSVRCPTSSANASATTAAHHVLSHRPRAPPTLSACHPSRSLKHKPLRFP